jgi:outer membrane protein with beta-barrel domain
VRHIVLAAFFCSCLAAPAVAQQDWPERFWIGVNGGAQVPAAGSVSNTFDIQQFAETGHVTTRYPSKTGALVDATFGVRIWKRLGVSLGVARASEKGSAGVSAEIPHPFFDNQLRHIEGTTSATHTDLVTHVRLAYLMPVGRRLRVMLTGGPSFFNVQQTVVTDVQFSQTFPFDTATFTRATTTSATASAVGFNAGGDAAWMLGRRIGVGASLQYARATVTEKAGGSRTISVDGGGAQLGLGLRLLF